MAGTEKRLRVRRPDQGTPWAKPANAAQLAFFHAELVCSLPGMAVDLTEYGYIFTGWDAFYNLNGGLVCSGCVLALVSLFSVNEVHRFLYG